MQLSAQVEKDLWQRGVPSGPSLTVVNGPPSYTPLRPAREGATRAILPRPWHQNHAGFWFITPQNSLYSKNPRMNFSRSLPMIYGSRVQKTRPIITDLIEKYTTINWFIQRHVNSVWKFNNYNYGIGYVAV